MKISFLIHNAYGMGGTIRTTFNLASALSEKHTVEIVSVFRHRDQPMLPCDPAVVLRHLVDIRKKSPGYEGEHADYRRPAKDFPTADSRWKQYSALTDERIGAFLKSLEADVVIGTRAGLNVQVARQAPRRVIRVAQEHLTLGSHSPRLVLTLRRAYLGLDAITTTTEADAAVYRARLRLPGVRISALPNSVPTPSDVMVSDCTAPYVIAAGRITEVKRYDVLVRAFAKVAAERPDWGLRIYGNGDCKESLTKLVAELGLQDNVRLMGQATPIEREMAKCSVLAVTSRLESFGMTIVEAMRVGLPVVSTDCPLGPKEIIDHGVDGLLVPVGNSEAVAEALLELINDDEKRRRMGHAALEKGERYDPALISERCTALLEELLEARGGASPYPDRVAGWLLGGVYATLDRGRFVARLPRRVVRKLWRSLPRPSRTGTR